MSILLWKVLRFVASRSNIVEANSQKVTQRNSHFLCAIKAINILIVFKIQGPTNMRILWICDGFAASASASASASVEISFERATGHNFSPIDLIFGMDIRYG
jgi:hypothetical protein